MTKWKIYVVGWWKLSRVPFLSVGILPLVLGFVLAWQWGYKGPLGLYLLSSMAVIFIMWMTYYLGEWNDLEGDRLNQKFNQFSGGSRVLVEGGLPIKVSLLLGYFCLAGAISTGLYIYFHYKTGPWTLLLGGIGIFSGFSYSGKPFRWSYRGVGEIFIGFCYSWLPIATGFYLFTGFFSHHLLLLSIPVGLSIFNVILINEFPDEEADHAVGKKNLMVRFGKERMSDLYIGVSILLGLSLIKVLWIFNKPPFWLLLLTGIPLLLILWNLTQIWNVVKLDDRRMERLCRNTLFINLSITMILTIQQSLIQFILRR
jgi:1,4-dihydroxy-2-naphthoate octaprenyltransferase